MGKNEKNVTLVWEETKSASHLVLVGNISMTKPHRKVWNIQKEDKCQGNTKQNIIKCCVGILMLDKKEFKAETV